MLSDPEPVESTFLLDCQGAIPFADSDGPEITHFFETQGGMPGIVYPNSVGTFGKGFDFRQKPGV
ncbi:MAG: hypothetical protein K8R46_11200 [Pirellulales bacterium]|nr:hypothetical protein [Pirellulales bacterium]